MSDCLIIGGGIIGLLTAHELNSAGAKVTLLERNQTGRESSWAAGGIISPLYPWRYPDAVNALARWSQHHYGALAETLKQESGIDPEFIASGLLILDVEDRADALAWAAETGNRMESLYSTVTLSREPALAKPGKDALWMPEVAQIRNPRMMASLRKALEGRIEIRERIGVESLLTNTGRAVGVSTTKGTLGADRIIVCAGAWSRSLLAPRGSPPDIEPVRGQMLLFQAEPDLLSSIVLYQNHYAIPRRDGRILVGSTLERVGFDKSTTESARAELYEIATGLIPALADYPTEKHWAGLRPGSPEGIPYIGRHPKLENLYLNSGHFRNGVVLGPASARLLADIVLERPPILPIAPYTLNTERFA